MGTIWKILQLKDSFNQMYDYMENHYKWENEMYFHGDEVTTLP